ncbi:MAG: RNA polymerase sigma factor [Myxococcaceae bacterium]
MADLDHELDAIVAGDSDAFGRWVAGAEVELRASLRPFAVLVDTEAVLQEALLRVWQVAPRFSSDGRPNGLLRLAVTTARNLARSELRRTRPDPLEMEALERALAATAAVEPSGPDPLLRRLIVYCREKLGGKPAAALSQRLENAGAERDEVLAARLGMTLNTFLQNFSRARKLLAACLKSKGVDLEVELR